MSDFHRTVMGQKFFEASVPALIKELKQLNSNLSSVDIADLDHIATHLDRIAHSLEVIANCMPTIVEIADKAGDALRGIERNVGR